MTAQRPPQRNAPDYIAGPWDWVGGKLQRVGYRRSYRFWPSSGRRWHQVIIFTPAKRRATGGE